MHRETEILQDRIEVAAFQRSLGEPPKRVGGKEDEKIKRGCDPGLHRQHVGLERSRQIDAERCDQGAEQRQDQHPQQHRAFVIAPDAGELVDQRHLRMRILVNIDHREIRRHIAKCQRAERQHHKGKLRQRGGVGEFHQRDIALACAKHRRPRLDQRQRERQYKRVVTEFGDHGGVFPVHFTLCRTLAGFGAAVSCQCPCFFRVSTISRGM